MRKKIILLFMMNFMIVSIVGCGKKEENLNIPASTEEKQVIETEKQEKPEEEYMIGTEETVADPKVSTEASTEEVSSDTTTKQQSEEVENKYLEVLRNEATFIDTNNGSTPSYMSSIYYGDGVVCTPEKYTLVDYDRDGEPEVCVQVDLGFDSEFVVLHYFDGNVYGYSFVYRGMELIGNNGYYIGSNGAAYTYILSLAFNESKMVENTVAYSDLDSENNPVYFDGNGTQMDEADWSALLNSIDNDAVTWNSFADSNIQGLQNLNKSLL